MIGFLIGCVAGFFVAGIVNWLMAQFFKGFNEFDYRAYPSIQGGVVTIAMTYVLVTLLVDILYVYIDPRIRLGGE